MLTHLEFPPVISKEHYEEITPLCAAAEDDNLAIVKELLTQKANIEGNDKNNTPLIIALREDHINIAKYLIEEKADCSHPMVLGYAANLDADLVQTILDKKVDVDTITEDEGITALMVAAYNGPIENVKKFLALGADRTLAMDSGGKTALHLAAENGRLDVVEMLLVDNPVFDAVSNEGSALSIAFKKNHPKVVELLLNHGANIHVKIDDKNLLMYAIYRNFPECLEVLLKHYVNLNIPIEKNNDLLSYAAQQNFSECVEILLKHQFTFTTLDPYRLLDEAYHEGYKDTFEALLLHDEEKIKNYLDIRKKTPLKKVDFSNIKKDSEYFRLFQHENKNSAIRILQRQWRKKHLGKYKVSDQKTFPSKLSLYAIQEPVGFKAEEHANHIKEGNWLLLDFNDPEFSRNIYKALRQTRITMNEMATAYFLYHTKNLMKDEKRPVQLRQHMFDNEGPYSPKQIDYAQPYQLENFQRMLSWLPKHEQCYFSIDCSRKFELVFLCQGLTHGSFALSVDRFRFFLIKLINKMALSQKEKNEAMEDVNNLQKQWRLDLANKLKQMILNHYPDLKEFYSKKPREDTEYSSPALMIATFAVNDQNPCLAISPDYDETDGTSPLLCRIILTVSAFNELQSAMHHSHATKPYFTAGQVTTRLIRTLDETEQARPVEMAHDDLILTKIAHGFLNVHPAIISEHDMFHCFRNGALTFKDMLRHMRKIHELVKGYDMSKLIWFLSDMDISAGRLERLCFKNNVRWGSKTAWINMILEKETGSLAVCDNNELFITLIDMIKNKILWTKFLGQTPEKHFVDKPAVLSFMENIKKIMTEYSKNQPIMFYILAYRLRETETALIDAKEVLDELSENPAFLKKMFEWERSGWVCFSTSIVPIYETHELELLQPQEIIKYCKKYLNSVHPKNKAKKMEINYFTEMTGCGAKLLSGKLNMWSQKMVVSYEETDVSLPRLYRV